MTQLKAILYIVLLFSVNLVAKIHFSQIMKQFQSSPCKSSEMFHIFLLFTFIMICFVLHYLGSKLQNNYFCISLSRYFPYFVNSWKLYHGFFSFCFWSKWEYEIWFAVYSAVTTIGVYQLWWLALLRTPEMWKGSIVF